MKKIVLALATLGAFATGSAFAQGYVSAAIGQSRINVDCSGADCDKKDTAWKLIGGFKFMPNVAAELTYFDYGKLKFSGLAVPVDVGGVTVDAATAGDIEVTGVGLGVALLGEFTPQWSGVARLGIASNRAKFSGDAAIPLVGTVSFSDSERKTKPYAGFAVGYAFSPQLKLEAGFDFSRFEVAGDSDNVRMFTIGLTYGF